MFVRCSIFLIKRDSGKLKNFKKKTVTGHYLTRNGAWFGMRLVKVRSQMFCLTI